MVSVAPTPGMKSFEETLKTLRPEEITKIEKSFKDPKFMELLADYAKDMADPETKAEQELYLRQLEAENRGEEMYGKGMQLFSPNPSFVAKTANSQSGQKIFINVCTSEKVGVASSKQVKQADGSIKRGLQWEVPNLLGKCKEGSDRNKIQCMVMDFVVHPDTCRMALNNARFKALILDSAADSIEKREGWNLTRHYSFPKLAFKVTPGVTQPGTLRSVRQDTQPPITQPIAHGGSQRTGGAATSSSIQQESKPLATQVSSLNAQDPGRAAKSSGFKFPSARVPKQDAAPIRSQSHSKSASSSSSDSSSRLGSAAAADSELELMRPLATTRMETVALNARSTATAETGSADGEVQPTYELVYRGHMDLAQAWEGPGVEVASAKMPKELVIRIDLPGIQHAKQAELDVESEKLNLTVTGKYHLQLVLPHRVAAADGTASFNSSKQQLEVVLPVLPSAPSANTVKPTAQQQQQQANVGTQSQDRGAGSAHEPSDNVHDCDLASSSSAHAISSPENPAPNHDQLAEVCHNSQDRQQNGDSLTQQSSDRPGAEPLTANQRKWLELHPKPSSSKDAVTQSSASHATATVDTDTLKAAAAAGDLFIASTTFSGQLPDYVFTSRDQGVGYYKDASMAAEPNTSADEVAACNIELETPESIAVPFVLKPRLRTRAAAEGLD